MIHSKKNVCMFGAFSGNNRGDFAILETIVNSIKNDVKYVYISSKKPKRIGNELGNINNVKVFKTYSSYIGIKSLYYIYKSDVITIGGGGLFFERNFYNFFFNHIIGISFVIFIAKIFKKDTYIFSVGVEKFSKSIPKYFLKYILKNTSSISVRDSDSLEIFKAIYHREYNLFADPVLSIKHSHPTIKKTGAIIIVNSSTINDKNLIKVIHLLQKMNINVTLFENERSQKLVMDFIFTNTLENEVSYISENKFKNSNQSIDFISKFELVISAPMHGAIFSYIGGTPFICISWNEKVKSFIDIVDNNFYVLDSFGEIQEKHIQDTISQKIILKNLLAVQQKSQKGIDYFIDTFLK